MYDIRDFLLFYLHSKHREYFIRAANSGETTVKRTQLSADD